MDYVDKAIESAGGIALTAQQFQISAESVYKWRRRHRVPADRVIDLCRLGKWRVTPHQLSPAYYPQPMDGLPIKRARRSKVKITHANG